MYHHDVTRKCHHFIAHWQEYNLDNLDSILNSSEISLMSKGKQRYYCHWDFSRIRKWSQNVASWRINVLLLSVGGYSWILLVLFSSRIPSEGFNSVNVVITLASSTFSQIPRVLLPRMLRLPRCVTLCVTCDWARDTWPRDQPHMVPGGIFSINMEPFYIKN